MRSVALELVDEVLPDPREILLERDPLVVREPSVVRLGMALALREQRTHPGRGVAGGRSRLRIEIEVEADRATLLRPELRELAEPVPSSLSRPCRFLSHESGDSTHVTPVIHTIGHGRRPVEELVGCLREASVETLVDVRRFPSSRRNPQFDQATLAATLADAGIAYEHAAELGGLRSERAGRGAVRVSRPVRGLRSADVHDGLADGALNEALTQPTPCLMCAETPWQRCHRRLIAEFLVARGREVVHLIEPGIHERHNAHRAAELRDGILYLCGEPVGEVSSDPIR